MSLLKKVFTFRCLVVLLGPVGHNFFSPETRHTILYTLFSALCALRSVGGLVPLDAVGEGGAFVVFEVGEHGGVDGDVEVVGFVGAYGYEAGCHGEAVEVA